MRTNTATAAFAGEKLQRRELPGFALAETLYPAALRMPRHGHETAYLTLVLRGGYDETVGHQQVRSCAPATLVFHPPDEEHAIVFHREPVRIFRLEAKPDWLARVREHTALFDQPGAFDSGAPAQLALRLYHESHASDAAAPLAIESAVLELLSTTTRQLTSTAAPPPWLQRAREVLHAQWAESPALADVAQAAGVHPVSLARAFRRHFHCSIGDYLRRLRIENACQQIAQSDTSLIEIAHAAGFYDQSHFARTFKRHTGLTPAAYRAARRAS